MNTLWYGILGIYHLLIVAVSFYFFLLTLINISEMKRHTVAANLTEGPMISVLVPVRNEEDHIGLCLASLCNQDYTNYEILVIDDNSRDKTMAILRMIAGIDKRIRIFKGKPIPKGWYGKPYVLQQLSAEARGEILIFTDADTIHSATSISWAVSNMKNSAADFISGHVGQRFRSFGERITTPLIFFLTGFILPLILNRVSKSETFSSSMGQFSVIKRMVFREIGGFTKMWKKTDIHLTHYLKRRGYRTLFLDLADQVQCRMYEGYWAAVAGIGKRIFAFLGTNNLIIFLITLGAFVFLFLPFPLLFLEGNHPPHVVNLIIVNCMYTITWVLLFRDRRISWYHALLWPLLFLNLFYTTGLSWFKIVSGQGFRWKGRVVS
jgi:chlorobactene glucosyltransferase